MTLEAQRGNVTIITAVTAMLMTMLVVLASGLGQQSGTASQIQAGSDEAAVTAALSYIEVVNDEVMFDILDWTLKFLQHLADLAEQLGELLEAVPIPPIDVIGAGLAAIASTVSSIVGDADTIVVDIKKALDPILEKAKSILAIINATIIAAKNDYLGFVLPGGLLQAAGQAKYTLDDVKKITDHSKQIIDNSALVNVIELGALHTIWTSDTDGSSGNQCQGQPCKPQNRLGPANDRHPERDTFHIWNDDTPGCAGNNWSRPCNEQDWLKQLVRNPYKQAVTFLDDLEKKINFGGANNNPVLFQGSDPNKEAQEKKDAQKLIDDTKAALQSAADGSGKPNLDKWISDTNKKYDSTNAGDDPFKNCPDGPNKAGQYFSLICNQDERIAGSATCDTDTKKSPTPCQDYWNFDKGNASRQFLKGASLPKDAPIDYTDSKNFAGEINSNDSKAYSDWQKAYFSPSAKGVEASGEAEMDFVMIARTPPSLMRQLAANVGNRPDLANNRVSVSASIAKLYRATDVRDTVRLNDLCDALDPKHKGATSHLSFPLSFLPDTFWGFCHVLLGSLDAIRDIYNAINGFFQPIIDGLNSISIFGFKPLGWLADLIAGIRDELIGPPFPEARTFHAVLVPVACVPLLDKIAYLAANTPTSIGDVLNDIEQFALKGTTPPDTTSSCGPSQKINGGNGIFG